MQDRLRAMFLDHLSILRGKYLPASKIGDGSTRFCRSTFGVHYDKDLLDAPGAMMMQGLPDMELTWRADEIRDGWPEEYARRHAGLDPRIAGWDSSATVAARVASCLDELSDDLGLVIAVSHGGAITAGTLALMGLDAYSTTLGKLEHGRWNVLRKRGNAAWSLERYAIGPSAIRSL